MLDANSFSHIDLIPERILLTQNGHIKINDFIVPSSLLDE
jgi:serine/threonine protein kinase